MTRRMTMSMMTTTTYSKKNSQLCDLIETWVFREDLKPIILHHEDDDNDDDDDKEEDNDKEEDTNDKEDNYNNDNNNNKFKFQSFGT